MLSTFKTNQLILAHEADETPISQISNSSIHEQVDPKKTVVTDSTANESEAEQYSNGASDGHAVPQKVTFEGKLSHLNLPQGTSSQSSNFRVYRLQRALV